MRSFIFFLFLILLIADSKAQQTLTTIRHKDLMSEQVFKITQDGKGFIWISDRFGINRYDGYYVKHYEIPMLANANPVRYINVLSNAQKEIYAYTSNGGIYKYNRNTDGFQLLKNLNIYLRAVYIDDKDNIWFGSNGVLGVLRDTAVTYIETPLLENFLVKNIIDYSPSQKIIIADYAILLIDAKTRIAKYFFDKEKRNTLAGTQIETGYLDKKQQVLWLGSVGKGLISYNLPAKKIETVAPLQYQAMIMSVNSLNDSVLIAGTDGKGAVLIDKKKKSIIKKLNLYEGVEHLSGDAIYDIFKDKDQRIWIATDGGISVMETPLSGFHIELRREDNPNLIMKDVVTCLLEDSDGNQWIGTNGGLSLKNVSSNSVSYLLKSSYILSVYESSDGYLWVGTYGSGVYVLDKKGNIIQHYLKNSADKNSLSTDFIYAIAEDKQGNMWLGGKKGVTSRFNRKTKQFTHVPLVQVNHFTNSGEGNLLAATEIGLFEIDIKSFKVINHPINKKLKSKYICDIYQQGDSVLWLATYGAGLARYQTKSATLNYINTYDRAVQEIAYSLVPEGNNRLWVAGKDKISSIETDSFTVKNYPKKLMALNMSFFQTSRMRSATGDIFFGGTKGFISFNPKAISAPETSDKIVFLNFNLFNREIKAGDKDSPLQKPLDDVSSITLQHQQHSFSFSFTTINFSQAVERRFVWKLDGLDKNWVGPSAENMANYTNLSPGKYVFHVKAIGNNNEVLDHRTINIYIRPAFYKTWIAYCIYLSIIAGLVYLFMRQVRIRAYLKSSLEFEKREKKRTEELTQSKLNFFTNISHEIRTPVTLITGQAEQLLNSGSVQPNVHSKLQGIYKNAVNLGGLINELLDFRKQEEGHLKLHFSKVNMVELLKDTSSVFLEQAKQKGIIFSFEYDTDSSIELPLDKEQIKKVINNLLSNAIKATPKGGIVKLKLEQNADAVILAVEDTGKGIPADELAHIFEPFYQIGQGTNASTGIGLSIAKNIVELHEGRIEAASQVGKGSIFKVYFNKNAVLQYADEVQENVIDTVTEDMSVNEYEPFQDNETVNLSESDKTLLLVEDNEELRAFIKEILSPLFDVLTAGDGVQGLEIARSQQPDIIISDVMMPNMSGTELCVKLKSNFDTCHIPVVLLTAKSAIEHQLEGLRTGADDYITKPFHSKLLIQRCNNLIGARQLLKAKYLNQPGLDNQQEVATTEIDRKFIEQATAIVESRLESEIDVNLFAAEMGLSRSSLFSKLKGVTGLTPNTFISNIRLKKAADMLSNSPELNISQIAYTLGFSSPRYFNKCFKELYGYSPQEYRKKRQKTD